MVLYKLNGTLIQNKPFIFTGGIQMGIMRTPIKVIMGRNIYHKLLPMTCTTTDVCDEYHCFPHMHTHTHTWPVLVLTK